MKVFLIVIIVCALAYNFCLEQENIRLLTENNRLSNIIASHLLKHKKLTLKNKEHKHEK